MKTRINVILQMDLQDISRLVPVLQLDNCILYTLETVPGTTPKFPVGPHQAQPEPEQPEKKQKRNFRGPDTKKRKPPRWVTPAIVRWVKRMDVKLEKDGTHASHRQLADLMPEKLTVSDKTVGKIRSGHYDHLLEIENGEQ